MKMFIPLLLLVVVFSCSKTENSNKPTQTQTEVKKMTADTEFTFPVQGGAEIKATVYPAYEFGAPYKMVILLPLMESNDSTFYNASLHSLTNIYGKERGLIQLQNAKSEYDSKIGASVDYWNISNPSQKFHSCRINDGPTGKTFGLIVWVD